MVLYTFFPPPIPQFRTWFGSLKHSNMISALSNCVHNLFTYVQRHYLTFCAFSWVNSVCALYHSAMWLHVQSLAPGMGSLIQRISCTVMGLDPKPHGFVISKPSGCSGNRLLEPEPKTLGSLLCLTHCHGSGRRPI